MKQPIIPGFYPDPSACRVGSDFYLACSSFEYFPGLPIFHSRDLIHWKQIGHVLDRSEQLDLGRVHSSRGIWAPALRHHQGKFYLVTTCMFPEGGKQLLFTATNPQGPWSDPVETGWDTADPSLFFDEDGRIYLPCCRRAPTQPQGIYLSELDQNTFRIREEPRMIWEGSGGSYPEGPHLFRRGGWIYLLVAEGGTQGGHMETVARALSPWSPYEPCPRNPILTNRHIQRETWQGIGHADRVVDPHGKEWLVLHGYRYAKEFFHPLGREVLLAPLTWSENGWPTIEPDGTIRDEVPPTGLPEHSWPVEKSGLFSPEGGLGMQWVSLRGRKKDHYRTDRKPDTLSLNGAGLSLETSPQPTAVFHRQQHFEFVADVLIDFPSTGPEGSAGLTVFYDQEHHYDFRITRAGSGLCLELYRRIGDLAAVTHRCPLDTGPWRLRVRGNRHFYSFSRAVQNGWEELGTARIEYVCTEATPVSFTGVMIGLFSESQEVGESWADFREFSYRPEKA